MTAPTFVEPATEVDVPTPEPADAQVRSAYPPAVDDLLPRAREISAELGATPSRNRLMRELKIGPDKANAVRDALLTEVELRFAAESEPDTDDATARPAPPAAQVITVDASPGTPTPPVAVQPAGKPVRAWPILFLAAGAFVAIWSGWVGIGGLTGFGVVHLLPGIWDGFKVNTAITLPIGVEAYAAFALRVWLSGRVPARARRFARWSAIGSLGLGCAGQVAYHLMAAAHVTTAPWWITMLVSCFPVAVLGMGAALAHLLREGDES